MTKFSDIIHSINKSDLSEEDKFKYINNLRQEMNSFVDYFSQVVKMQTYADSMSGRQWTTADEYIFKSMDETRRAYHDLCVISCHDLNDICDNLKLEHILNNQVIDQDEAKSILKTKKTFKRTLTSGSKGPFLTSPRAGGNLKRLETGIYGERANIVREKVYNNCEDVKLDKEALQDYFAYEALNLVDSKFRIKKSKKQTEAEIEFDEDVDLAKPIPGKAEIQVYDRKTNVLVKRNIKFDKY